MLGVRLSLDRVRRGLGVCVYIGVSVFRLGCVPGMHKKLVKVCGITSVDDALVTVDLGADWIGVNLVAGPRRIDCGVAEEILLNVPDAHRVVALVRVTDRGGRNVVIDTLQRSGLHRVQLYGAPITRTVADFQSMGLESVMVQPFGDASAAVSIDEILAGCADAKPEYLLLDAHDERKLGGTGRRANWDAVAGCRQDGCFDRWPTLLLAGGLTPDNVRTAIDQVQPFGVDVCSGVESAPGRKDPSKLREFIAAVRG